MKEEYQKQFNMEYMDLAAYLQEKYGKPIGSYFLNENCKSTNNKIKRIKDGLFIHHIAEFHEDYPTICALSGTEEALKYPFTFQSPDWLCYCDYLSHLILHYKIHSLRVYKYKLDTLDDGIAHFMLPELKMWYITNGKIVKGKWQEPIWERIKDEKDTFIEIYNKFYKEFPNTPKYSYGEYLRNERKKSQR